VDAGGGSGAGSACSAQPCGPTLVEVPAPEGGSYWMDETEVTNSQYSDFLETHPTTRGQPSECEWNGSYVPGGEWPASSRGEHPVAFVDWCDARAYCEWAGKRLCGRIGGGLLAQANQADPTQSEWYNACSAGGTKTYPYGDSYDDSACNGFRNGSEQTVAVASGDCEGGVPGLFDLSGNVWEWDDACDGTTGAADLCLGRGGSVGLSPSLLECSSARTDERNSRFFDAGFRCCRD
jgi:formylglycine-generating enzyme required for sulfatase activity